MFNPFIDYFPETITFCFCYPVSYTHLENPLRSSTSLVSVCMKIMSVLITVILYGRMIEIYLYCSVSPIPFATMTNREWGQIGNNYILMTGPATKVFDGEIEDKY